MNAGSFVLGLFTGIVIGMMLELGSKGMTE